MLKLFITAYGQTEDITRYLDGTSIQVTEQSNIPSLCTFNLYPIDARFSVPRQRAYVQLFSTLQQKSIFSGFINMEPTRAYLGRSATVPAQFQGQLFTYGISCTSDEYILQLKAIPFIPSFINRYQGEILATLAEILAPGFFDTSLIAQGDLVPKFDYDPTQSWAEVAKLFGDGSRYRYKARDRKLWYQPFGDQSLGIAYDEDTMRQNQFSPVDLRANVLAVPFVNDITIIGDTEGGNNREDYFIGDGFTGNYNLLHKVFRGSSTAVVQESWNNNQLNLQQWFLQDPGNNFNFAAGALNVVDTLPSSFASGLSYLALNNGLELAGGIDIQTGEVIFSDYCDGVLGGLYLDTTFGDALFVAGFGISSPHGVVTSASGANGVYMQPSLSGQLLGTPIVSQQNHSYVLQMRIHAPVYTRFDQTYRTLDGQQFGGGSNAASGSITWAIQDYDIGAATGIFYQPVVTEFSVNNVLLPDFVVMALVNNHKMTLSIVNTTVSIMPLGGLLALEGPSGLMQPTGLILPMLPPGSGGFIGVAHGPAPAPAPPSGSPVVDLSNLDGLGNYTNWTSSQNAGFGNAGPSITVVTTFNSGSAPFAGVAETTYASAVDTTNFGGTGRQRNTDQFAFNFEIDDASTLVFVNIRLLTSTPGNSFFHEWDFTTGHTPGDGSPYAPFAVTSGVPTQVLLQRILMYAIGTAPDWADITGVVITVGTTGLVSWTFDTYQVTGVIPAPPDPNPLGWTGQDILLPPGLLATTEDVLLLGNGYDLQAAQITEGNTSDVLGFYAQSLPAAGTRIRFQSWQAQAAVSRLQISGSIIDEAALVGDDGIRSAIVTNLNPLPRTSVDCDSAALAFLQDRAGVSYNGTYIATNVPPASFFHGTSSDEQYWPTVGRFLNVNAPRRGMEKLRFFVTQLTCKVLDLQSEFLEWSLTFGSDLILEKVLHNFVDLTPKNVLTPSDAAQPPSPRYTQNVNNSFLPDLNQTHVDLATLGNSIDVEVLDPWFGLIEVRRLDTNWGNSQLLPGVIDSTLIAVIPQGPRFTLPRTQIDQVWYIRPVSLASSAFGVQTSRRSKVLRVLWPLQPASPLFVSQQGSIAQFNFNGDQRNIYGFELRVVLASGETVVLVQRPVASYSDMTIDVQLTAFPQFPDFGNPSWTLYAYFFNTAWVFSDPVVVSMVAPAT